MKFRILWIISAIIAILFSLGICLHISNENKTGLYFPQSVINVGIHHDTIPFEAIVKFKNVSSSPIEIDSIKSSCGCATPRWMKSRIEADSDSSFLVNFYPKPYPTRIDPLLTLTWHYLNSAIKNTVQIGLVGSIESSILFSPSAIEYDDLNVASKSLPFSIDVTRGKSKELWNDLSVESGYISGLNVQRISDDHFRIHGEMSSSNLPIGVFKDTITIFLRNHSAVLPFTYRIPITANIVGELKAIPSSIYLGVIQNSKIILGNIMIHRSDSMIDGSKLIGIESDSPKFIQASAFNANTSSIQIRYRINPAYLKGQINGRLRVYFLCKSKVELDIPYIAFIKD